MARDPFPQYHPDDMAGRAHALQLELAALDLKRAKAAAKKQAAAAKKQIESKRGRS